MVVIFFAFGTTGTFLVCEFWCWCCCQKKNSWVVHRNEGGQKKWNPKRTRWWFHVFLCSPLFGEDSHFDEHIFQMGWFNHQPEKNTKKCFSSPSPQNHLTNSYIPGTPNNHLLLVVSIGWRFPNHYHGKMVGNHHFHPLKFGCLGYQVLPNPSITHVFFLLLGYLKHTIGPFYGLRGVHGICPSKATGMGSIDDLCTSSLTLQFVGCHAGGWVGVGVTIWGE